LARPAAPLAPILAPPHAKQVEGAESAEVRRFLAEQGPICLPHGCGAFARRAAPERERWGRIVVARWIKVD
jgi:hypothetical protein